MPFVKGQSGNPDKVFKKGESGNPNGRPVTKPIEEAFQEFLYQFAKSKDGQERQRLDVLMARLFADAANGNVKASTELLNRAFGKSKQRNEHTGPDGTPVQIEAKTDPETLAEAMRLFKAKEGL